jgi:uncharacterized protein (DUF1501 family)
MLVPHSCNSTNGDGKTLVEQYNAERTSIAMKDDERTRIIKASNQPCEEFAIHPNLNFVETLYKEGSLSFFANAGLLNVPVNKKNYSRLTKSTLFAHNSMQAEALKVDPFERFPSSGFLGRLSDYLIQAGFVAVPISVEDVTIATAGIPGRRSRVLSVSSSETTDFNPKPAKEFYNPQPHLEDLNSRSHLQSSIFGKKWSEGLIQSIYTMKGLNDDVSKVTLSQSWIGDEYIQKLKTAAMLISARDDRGSDRDSIFVQLNDWDHHNVSMEKSYFSYY